MYIFGGHLFGHGIVFSLKAHALDDDDDNSKYYLRVRDVSAGMLILWGRGSVGGCVNF